MNTSVQVFPTDLVESPVIELRSRLQGQVITPSDSQYDQARQAWNLSVDQRPAVIVIAQSAEDVSQAVRFARRQGLGIAVQSSGHGVVCPANEALLIITNQLRQLRVDAENQRAWIGAGLKWGMVLAKAQEFGLAPLLGSSPDVGVVGYTLGGGMGWLARKYGLSADSVISIELVTAEGEIIQASQEQNRELFWGLRGGGGSFGVVTGMEIQLYPVTTVYGGNLVYPAELAREVIAHYRDWIADAPDELTTSIAIMNFPPIPAVPEFLRGKSVVIVRGCYCGPVEQGEALLQSWRDWKAPIIDDFKAMPFSQVAAISNDPEDPSPSISSGAWLKDLSDGAIDTLIRYAVSVNGSSPLVATEVRHAGGKIAKVDPQFNAFGNRDATQSLQVIGMTPTPEAHRQVGQYIAQMKQALVPYLTGGVYINFLEGEEARQRTRDAYLPETYRKLQALKAKYDPENFFRFGFDIPPARA
jgi:FAD binding domain/Berberine and berberine like